MVHSSCQSIISPLREAGCDAVVSADARYVPSRVAQRLTSTPIAAVRASIDIGVFGVELSYNSGWYCKHVDLAKLCACGANASIGVDIGLVAELPDAPIGDVTRS